MNFIKHHSIFIALVFAVLPLFGIAKVTNPSTSHLLKIEKAYSKCVTKTEGVTSEMLDCTSIAIKMLDVHLWPLKNRRHELLLERKKVIDAIDSICTKKSAENEGTSWSLVYAGCTYDQMVEEVRKISRSRLIGD